MKKSRRKRMHAAMRQEIKTTAWEQIAVEGAAGLSLRAIARQMEITAPALYRYYSSRDDLVTDLIVEAFTSLAEALEAAVAAPPSGDHAGRLTACGMAYRRWALDHPERYDLIFGTPIPGYSAPTEITLPAASRSLGVLMSVLAQAWEAGALELPPEYEQLPTGLETQLENWRKANLLEAPAPVLYLTLVGWSRVHGLVSLELDNQLPPAITDPGDLFKNEMTAFGRQIGLL